MPWCAAEYASPPHPPGISHTVFPSGKTLPVARCPLPPSSPVQCAVAPPVADTFFFGSPPPRRFRWDVRFHFFIHVWWIPFMLPLGYGHECGRSCLEKKRYKRWEASKFVMRLAKALLAHEQTRTSVMSVQRNEVAGAERRGACRKP